MAVLKQLAAAISRTLRSEGWALLGHGERVERLMRAVTAELSGRVAPRPESLDVAIDREKRNDLIRRQHGQGVAIAALAERHGLSDRHVRRIVCDR